MGRPEEDPGRRSSMTLRGNGLSESMHHEDALSVYEAELSVLQRIGGSEAHILAALCNLAGTYHSLKQHDTSRAMFRAAYDNAIAELGPDHALSINSALNLLSILVDTKCAGVGPSQSRRRHSR